MKSSSPELLTIAIEVLFGPDPHIRLIPLFRKLAVTTSGGAANAKSYLDLDVPEVRTLLPYASGLFLIGLTENVSSTEFAWNVACFSGVDRDHQPATPFDIFNVGVLTSALPQGQRTTEYPTVSNFLLDSRLQLWFANPLNTNVRTALISCVLGVRLST